MLIGHQNQWEFLTKSVKLDKLPHALLFAGEAGLGKRRTAIEFVKFLNCADAGVVSNKLPCQRCRNCQDIEKNQFPDLIIVEPQGAENLAGREIQIDQIRELRRKLSLKSYGSKFKVALIDSCQAMNQETQNCFLKVLEEPKGETLLILIAEFPQLLLPTITSRAQKIKFYPVSKIEIENYLIESGSDPDSARKITVLTRGRPGVAIDFLRNPEKLKESEKIILDLAELAKSPLARRFEYVKAVVKGNSEEEEKESPAGLGKSPGVREILNIWLGYARSSLVKQAESFSAAEDDWKKIKKTKKIIQLIQRLDFLLSTTNVNPKLALELLMLEI